MIVTVDRSMTPQDYARIAAESRVAAIEAAIHRYRECGVEIERFSIVEANNGVTHLCIEPIGSVFSWCIARRDLEGR